ncbi:MAG: hypothetical protein JWO33_353 [Caulobacteraceae bacterium]|nr:hypothetical protein [Caulobacteraceae bacterium]
MSERPKLKKSESLEIRLPYPTKQAFMARCRDDGRSASDAMRGFIDFYLDGEARRARAGARGWKLIAAGSAAALMAAAMAAPTVARTMLQPSAAEAEFLKLDANHDGRLSLAEFERLRVRP